MPSGPGDFGGGGMPGAQKDDKKGGFPGMGDFGDFGGVVSAAFPSPVTNRRLAAVAVAHFLELTWVA